MLEAYATLGYLAARTARVRLGTMVSPATYRAPSVLIKAVTTLDVLSSGRAWLGIGSGYNEAEARALDLWLPQTRVRYEELEDTLRLALQMWRGDQSPFTGARHHLERPVSSPAPLTRPHPPILVGGMGEQRTLRLVAAYADACNLFDIPDGGQTIRRKLAVLAGHCRDAGRPPGSVERTASTRLNRDDTVDAVVARFRQLASFGIDHAVVITDRAFTDADIDTLAVAADALAEVEARPIVRLGAVPVDGARRGRRRRRPGQRPPALPGEGCARCRPRSSGGSTDPRTSRRMRSAPDGAHRWRRPRG
jgi:alkanesulfonate monooxygenase SsuD/methylene tetrahydromethanopterin reductase-like flavin-dependent oxidoreductase (luciferase family)